MYEASSLILPSLIEFNQLHVFADRFAPTSDNALQLGLVLELHASLRVCHLEWKTNFLTEVIWTW